MISPQKMSGYWTEQRCHKKALKYKSRFEFFRKCNAAYLAALRKGFLDKICGHMLEIRKPHHYWNSKKRCHAAALKCSSRQEFARKYARAYDISRDKGWLDETCSHMERKGNHAHRMIYVHEFPDNHAYVGLTLNMRKRQMDRKNDPEDPVTEHAKRTKLRSVEKELTDYLPVPEALKAESHYVQLYKENGWILLNSAKPGSLGGVVIKWSLQACLEVALKCESKKEFYSKYASAYDACLRNGWLPLIYRQMLGL